MRRDQREIEAFIEKDYEYFVTTTLNEAIEAIKRDSDYFDEIQHLYPFNLKQFKDLDWTKVDYARIEDHKLVLVMINED